MHNPGADRMQLYTWISTHTDINSVVIEWDPENYTPLFAHRRSFLPQPHYPEQMGYDMEMVNRYRTVLAEIFSENPISQASITDLLNLESDVYLLIWSDDLQARPYLDAKIKSHQPLFKKVYESSSGTVYLLDRSAAH
jgi:hypothetical protein